MHEYLERRHALQRQAPVTPPRYDDVYEHGVQWLQSLGRRRARSTGGRGRVLGRCVEVVGEAR